MSRVTKTAASLFVADKLSFLPPQPPFSPSLLLYTKVGQGPVLHILSTQLLKIPCRHVLRHKKY